MSLLDRILEDIKQAMRSGDAFTRDTLRFLQAAITNQRIAVGKELSDDEVIAVIRKQIQQREESAKAYKQAGQNEKSIKEEREAAVLTQYLPAQVPRAVIHDFVAALIQEEVEASRTPNQGSLIREARSHFGNSADGRTISEVVIELLKTS